MRPISRPKNAADSARRKIVLEAALIGDRPVHQPRAVGKEQVLADDAEMMPRLLGREQAGDDRSASSAAANS